MNKGKFYGIGVGPGDSELITVKAVRVIENLDILYVPKPRNSGESLAKKIADPYIHDTLEIKERHFPMNFNLEEKVTAWDSISSEIVKDVSDGRKVGFITLGDPMVYSTYVYLLRRVEDFAEVETVPGITSFINISSSNNFPLVMDRESLAVISCTDDCEKIGRIIDDFDSVVLMKVYRNFKDIISMIIEKGLESKSILVSNSSMENEKVCRKISDLLNEDSIPYFSTIIINKEN